MRYRLTHSAQADIVSILAWSEEEFGAEARERYQALIAAAIRDAGSRFDDVGGMARPELGEAVFSWHLSQSRARRSRGGVVRRPRHFLICRRDADVMVVGRVLHDAMDLRRHIDLSKLGNRCSLETVNAPTCTVNDPSRQVGERSGAEHVRIT